ncbi:pilus assembly protein [Paraburkholderia caballeronis]|uniref:Flp pilus assembly protein TadG n=1 Tax=Paraburkholderia caballeronis TaxID=416943 RepID=A0A1H7RS94_9BURK|nr:pilus assembly protein [Paraburkholderia caballeronis]PXW23169.1 hypothetical protein C7403_111151 [Paraburkholderia caballeronis]PXW97833.1 hypothetical protein C7407_111151 [Paraburkholderia caballeronis]RAJ94803.1 hypothetical protein C7409_111151 [Paraburkholderia caballeronis]SEE62503.1 hypothetical protein SAMN05445871_5525 [Paraburkholderia caballeronis]SEL62664.1 hypothetical protein SAMN05192542_110151 [Paraburkholderia caballeronis]
MNEILIAPAACRLPAPFDRGARRSRATDERGAVTLMFAVFASVMLGALSMSSDLARYELSQSRLQSALDVANLTAAVGIGHYVTNGCPSSANLQAWQNDAQKYYNANMPADYLDLWVPSTNFSATCAPNPSGGQLVKLSATGTLPVLVPAFLASDSNKSSSSSGGSGGDDGVQVTASNTVMRVPQSQLELVLVLDNTGSMSEAASSTRGSASKISGLKTAANNLLTNIFSQGANTYYVGIVPFASTVNVQGALSPAGAWLDTTFAYNPTGVQMSGSPSSTYSSSSQDWIWSGSGWGGCVAEPRDSSGNLSPEAYSPADVRKFTPYYYNVPPLSAGGFTVNTWSPGKNGNSQRICSGTKSSTVVSGLPLNIASSGSPNGCSDEPGATRPINYWDQKSSSNVNESPNQNSACIGLPVTFLTNNLSTLQGEINSMQPGGNTIIPVGLLWGWRMLSSAWANKTPQSHDGWIQNSSISTVLPMNESTVGLQRVMIVMTDGENSVSSSSTPGQEVLYFNGLSGVGRGDLQAPSVSRDDGSTLADANDPGSTGSVDDINTYQIAACNAIKQAGITIYGITFGSGASSSTAQTAMQLCSSPGDYYHAPDNTTLNSIFQQIASNIGLLRLVK